MKRSFHNLTIYTRPLTNGNLSLWVRHKFGSGKYSYSKTDIVIPPNSWDAKKKELMVLAHQKELLLNEYLNILLLNKIL